MLIVKFLRYTTPFEVACAGTNEPTVYKKPSSVSSYLIVPGRSVDVIYQPNLRSLVHVHGDNGESSSYVVGCEDSSYVAFHAAYVMNEDGKTIDKIAGWQ